MTVTNSSSASVHIQPPVVIEEASQAQQNASPVPALGHDVLFQDIQVPPVEVRDDDYTVQVIWSNPDGTTRQSILTPNNFRRYIELCFETSVNLPLPLTYQWIRRT